MALRVAEILKLPILADARVLAGEKGLDREVSQVTVGEVPDIGDWLTGGELVLSTFFAVETTPEAQVEFTRKIVKAGAAGLLVKPGRFIEEVSPAILELGRKHDFPIVEVPPEVRWTHITAEISEQIVGEHLALLRRSQDIHHRLLEVVIDGGSWKSIAETTSELIGRPVLLENSFSEVLSESAPAEDDPKLVAEFDELRKAAGANGRARAASSAERYNRTPLKKKTQFPAMVTVPIIVSRDVLGYVSSFERDSELNELDLTALESAATVAAVEMGRELTRMEAETRLRGDFVDDLLADEFDGGPTMLQRASFLGGDLSQGCLCLIADIDSFGDHVRDKKLTEPEVQQIKNRFFSGVKQEILSHHQHALLTPKSDNVIAFLPPLKDGDAKLMSIARSTALRIRQSCAELLPGLTVSIGIGRFHGDPLETRRAYREAQSALQVSQRLGETGAIASFDDMGIYKLLLGALEEDPEEVRNFYQETIARIEDYDKQHNTDLVGTLEAYLANNRSVAATAEALFTHRHTIRYRLGRINDLTGLDVHRSEDQEKLGFGLKVMRLLRR
ncbi:MAG: PucR family transcriptional regulator ligand-binding domain-containing protein [Actinobacteria bacterium]|nr:PucR family transcriptional regulator ligand-binding domain-containing protein [Actinomycetota bacterium]